MSQNSATKVVSNGSGSSVRSAMNGIFQDFNTTNSGTSAPTTPVQGMLWFDTTNSNLKVYHLSLIHI